MEVSSIEKANGASTLETSNAHDKPAFGDDGSLGDRLKELRSQKGLSLETIAQRTRVSVRYLQALEASDLSKLPRAAIIAKGYLKAYTRCLALGGAEEDDLMQKFAELEKAMSLNRDSMVLPSSTYQPVEVGEEVGEESCSTKSKLSDRVASIVFSPLSRAFGRVGSRLRHLCRLATHSAEAAQRWAASIPKRLCRRTSRDNPNAGPKGLAHEEGQDSTGDRLGPLNHTTGSSATWGAWARKNDVQIEHRCVEAGPYGDVKDARLDSIPRSAGAELGVGLAKYGIALAFALTFGAIVANTPPLTEVSIGHPELTGVRVMKVVSYIVCLHLVWLISRRTASYLVAYPCRLSFLSHILRPLSILVMLWGAYAVLNVVSDLFLDAASKSIYDWMFAMAIISTSLWLALAWMTKSAPKLDALAWEVSGRPPNARNSQA